MAIDVDSSVLWLGVGRGVRVIGSGDIGRILAFLALWCALEARWATRVASTTRLVVPGLNLSCLLYTSPSPRDLAVSRMPSSA